MLSLRAKITTLLTSKFGVYLIKASRLRVNRLIPNLDPLMTPRKTEGSKTMVDWPGLFILRPSWCFLATASRPSPAPTFLIVDLLAFVNNVVVSSINTKG